jgi:hypothetical protein
MILLVGVLGEGMVQRLNIATWLHAPSGKARANGVSHRERKLVASLPAWTMSFPCGENRDVVAVVSPATGTAGTATAGIRVT